MEGRKVTMLVTIMTVMMMGSLLDQSNAQKFSLDQREAEIIPFIHCYPTCLEECKTTHKFPEFLRCPIICFKSCLHPPSPSPSPSPSSSPSPSPSPSPSSLLEKTIDDTNDFCKFGCAVQHCASLSTLEIPNVKKVAACVDSCSIKCSSKN